MARRPLKLGGPRFNGVTATLIGRGGPSWDVNRTHKVLVAAAVVLFSIGLTIVAGEPPKEYRSVDEVRSSQPSEEVELVALVVPDTIRQGDDGLTRFTVRSESNTTMNVTYDEGLTEAFGADKWVVLSGTTAVEDGEVVFDADDVQVGCPSKWNAEKT